MDLRLVKSCGRFGLKFIPISVKRFVGIREAGLLAAMQAIGVPSSQVYKVTCTGTHIKEKSCIACL